MNPKIKTQDVSRNLYTNYLKRSDECFTAAKESLAKGDWNAAAIGAIHSGISAGDALCIYFLGKRHAGPNHRDAVVLLDIIKSGNILEIFLLLAPSFPVSVPRIYGQKAQALETGSVLLIYDAGAAFFAGATSSTTSVFRGIRSLLIAAS